jgi:hypothetical protein
MTVGAGTIVTTDVVGQIGVNPRIVKVNDPVSTYAQVSASGYLNSPNGNNVYQIKPTDSVLVDYVGGSTLFSVSFSGQTITLLDEGSDVITPTIANHIATYTNTSGTLSEDPATAITGGNLQAGLSGTAGTLASFPATELKGSFVIAAVANTGNTVTKLSNAAMGQATVITIPDPGTATANDVIAPAALVNNNLVKASGTAGLVQDAGARIISNTTAAFAGGGTTTTFAATGLTVAAKGSAVIRASTNSVSINKAVPGTDTLVVTFSADPGASTTVDYIYTTASQA